MRAFQQRSEPYCEGEIRMADTWCGLDFLLEGEYGEWPSRRMPGSGVRNCPGLLLQWLWRTIESKSGVNGPVFLNGYFLWDYSKRLTVRAQAQLEHSRAGVANSGGGRTWCRRKKETCTVTMNPSVESRYKVCG